MVNGSNGENIAAIVATEISKFHAEHIFFLNNILIYIIVKNIQSRFVSQLFTCAYLIGNLQGILVFNIVFHNTSSINMP